MITLGLDISTSIIGVCVRRDDETIVLKPIDLRPYDGRWAKVDVARTELEDILRPFKVNKVFVEEPMQKFAQGMSSAQTIVALAVFNGIMCNAVREITGIDPVHVNVNSARKTCGIKIDRKSDKSTKDQVLEFCMDQLPLQDWPTKTLKSGPRAGQTITDVTAYDCADAYVVARGGR